MKEIIRKNLSEAEDILKRFISEPDKLISVETAAEIIIQSLEEGGKVISCGNGGSMCDAMHFAQELSGIYKHERPALPAVSISDPSHITCTANDLGFENIFSRYIEGLGNKGDVLLAISTSGNSGNVLKAAEAALEKGMKVVALTGKTGGLLAKLAHVEIRVEGAKYSDRIQEMHIKILHILVELIEQEASAAG